MSEFLLPKKVSKPVEINVTNMIDIILILLIFFVMSSTFNRETGVAVTKPQAQSASALEKENILIAITREGNIHLNERQVDPAGLKDILSQIILRNPEKEAVIIADKSAQTGTLVQVMDACNLAGVKKVSIAALQQ